MSHYLKEELYELISKNHKVFDSLQQSSLDGLWYLDLENPENEWMNDKFWEILGYDPKDKKPLSSEWQDLIFPEDLQIAIQNLEKHLKDPNYEYCQIVRYKHKNGSTVWVRCRGMAIRDKNGKPIRMLGAHNDLTALKNIQQELKESKEFSELMFDASEDIMFVKDEKYRLVKANKAMLNLYPKDIQQSVIGTTTVEKFSVEEAKLFLKYDKIAFDKGSSRTIEYITTPTGEKKVIDTYKVRFYDKAGKPFILGIARDVTQREALLESIKQSNVKLNYIAYNDNLTKLLNRKGFIKTAESSLRKTKDNHFAALIMVDLDNFKFINGSFGYAVGDKLIITVANRLRACLPENSIIGRSGGDDFLILIKDQKNLQEIEDITKKIIKEISIPIKINKNTITQSVSIGIATYPNTASNIEKLLQNADIAMYSSKTMGKNTYSHYSIDYDEATKRHKSIERELLNIDMSEFNVVYHPQFDANTNIYGVEALIRWNSPILGNVTPDEFIPIAEKNQTIEKIGQWIFKKTISDWQELLKDNLVKDIKLSINISSIQLINNTFSDKIIKFFDKVDKNLITFEITETYLLNDIEHTRSIINKLNNKGFSFALDDFGTGYSSLKYLANLPIKYLKIDKSFVSDLDKENNKAIIKSIIHLANNLNKKCVAEGVETGEQLEFLKSIGCDFYQGFYFSKPIPFIELKKLLQSFQQTKLKK
ncbi:EAL domain-containing protein [Francisella sp. 19X1-34]|uniref:sensor domain-containing protein n=1 Tax=Francisella sp. 19X1-34 TaxID=3087177 RepID=UPI002E3316F0|nr:EAL domain-containing protein [Francisella sp. 19X1-34]MED7787502.1 EAL domain-containing protein [Francisella sp. 19X1-34]